MAAKRWLPGPPQPNILFCCSWIWHTEMCALRTSFSAGQVVEVDCSEYSGGHLRFWLKSTNNLSVQIEFVPPGGSIQKGSWTAPSTGNQWTEIVVPFTSFSPVPNLARTRGLFLITVAEGSGPKT